MIKFENTEVMGWEAAIRGMRNPMNSWEKSDSGSGCLERTLWGRTENGSKLCKDCSATYESRAICSGEKQFVIGPNDYDLMRRLSAGGPVHAKYRRMITVYVDITAPLYWWKEFDTYKVGTVANSCSTMHKIHAKEFTLDDFSCEHLVGIARDDLYGTLAVLNHFRKLYIETKDKKYWWQMIQLLPSSYNQKRTVMMNYEVLANIYKSRKNHKLDEWREHTADDKVIGYFGFCDWIKTLPYSELITQEEALVSE